MVEIEYHFDYLSPYAWFGWHDVRDLCARRGWSLVATPVLFGALLNHWGQLGPAEVPPKKRYVMRSSLREAARRGLPFRGPAKHPFRPLTALRLSSRQVAGEEQARVIDTLFAAGWSQGIDLGEDAAIAAALVAAGLDGDRLVAATRNQQSKDRLRADTERALDRGVFGVPTFLVGEELFWGVDSLVDLERFVDGEDPVTPEADARLLAMVAGADRRRPAPAPKPERVDVVRDLGGGRTWRSFGRPEDFQDRLGPLFARQGVVSDMIRSIAEQLTGPNARYETWALSALFDGGEPLVATLHTPPHAMHVTAATDEDLWPLVEIFPDVAGLFGPDGTVRRFAQLSGRPHEIDSRMRLFEARAVVPPRPCGGAMRPAVAADCALVGRWFDAFQEDVGEDVRRPGAECARLYEGRLFLWTSPGGEPVAMTGWGGRTPVTARVNAVYTPPHLRGRGHASNLVAGVSQHLFDQGCTYLTLFTDLTNPVSNSIYQKIGYRPVADLTKVRFQVS